MTTPHRVPALKRLGRAALGVCLGWAWASFVSLVWLGAASVWYGVLDRALANLKGEWWSPIAFAGYFASVPAGWVGGIVGPAVLGPGRFRRPVPTDVLLGGMLGSGIATLVGTVAGWAIWREDPRSLLVVWVPMGLGVVVGATAGWIAGRFVTAPASGDA